MILYASSSFGRDVLEGLLRFVYVDRDSHQESLNPTCGPEAPARFIPVRHFTLAHYRLQPF